MNDHRPVIGGSLLDPGINPLPLLGPVETPIDHVASPVRLPLEPGHAAGAVCPTYSLIRAFRNRVPDAPPPQDLAAPLVAVSFVGEQMVRSLPGASDSCLSRHPNRIQDRLKLGAVVPLTRRQHHHQEQSAPVTGRMQLGYQPNPAAPERRVGQVRTAPFLRAPAACWCARTTPLSMLTSQLT